MWKRASILTLIWMVILDNNPATCVGPFEVVSPNGYHAKKSQSSMYSRVCVCVCVWR